MLMYVLLFDVGPFYLWEVLNSHDFFSFSIDKWVYYWYILHKAVMILMQVFYKQNIPFSRRNTYQNGWQRNTCGLWNVCIICCSHQQFTNTPFILYPHQYLVSWALVTCSPAVKAHTWLCDLPFADIWWLMLFSICFLFAICDSPDHIKNEKIWGCSLVGRVHKQALGSISMDIVENTCLKNNK